MSSHSILLFLLNPSLLSFEYKYVLQLVQSSGIRPEPKKINLTSEKDGLLQTVLLLTVSFNHSCLEIENFKFPTTVGLLARYRLKVYCPGIGGFQIPAYCGVDSWIFN